MTSLSALSRSCVAIACVRKMPRIVVPALAIVALLPISGVHASLEASASRADLSRAVLRVNEVPPTFTSSNTHLYTGYSPFLKVKAMTMTGMATDNCQSPSITDGKYRQAMIQSFGTRHPVANFRICSFLYTDAGSARKAYAEEVRSVVADGNAWAATKVTSNLGDESVAYAGKSSEEVTVRHGSAVITMWYLDLKGVKINTSSFLKLGTTLLSRLH